MKKHLLIAIAVVLIGICTVAVIYRGPLIAFAADYGLLFDGTNDKASVTAVANNYLGKNAGTIEFWFKSSTGAAYQKFIKTDSSDVDIGMSQNFGGGARVFAEIGGAANIGEFDGGNYADGVCHAVAISWDGTNVRAYIDGTLKKTVAQSASQNNTASVMYVGHSNGSETLNGTIDEIRFSDTARYTGASYTLPTTKFSTDGNTKILWHFDAGSGSSATDSSGSGNTLVLDATNPPAWTTSTCGPLDPAAAVGPGTYFWGEQ